MESQVEAMKRRVLFIVDSESQIGPAYAVARWIANDLGWPLAGNIVPTSRGVSERQLASAGFECELSCLPIDDLVEKGMVADCGVLVAYLTGSRLHRVQVKSRLSAHARMAKRRPVFVTGYNGVVFEKHVEGLLWRAGYDVVAVNSAQDLDHFAGVLGELGYPASALVAAGMVVAQRPRVARAPERDKPFTVVFATQAKLPAARAEREYILSKLVEYARRYSGRRVIVKPRTLPGEHTFYRERWHYEVLYKEAVPEALRPRNLQFEYGPLSAVLSRADLLVTVSSTAVFEALANGVASAILTDFGIGESLGNHFFLGSGLCCSLEDLLRDRVPEADESWLRTNGLGAEESLDNLVARVRELLGEQERLGRPLRWPELYYRAANTPYLYQQALRPDDGRDGGGAWPRIVRKARKLRREPRQFFLNAVRNRVM